MPAGVRRAGARSRARRAGGEFLLAEVGAALLQGKTPLGNLLLVDAMDDGEEAVGGIELRGGLSERGKGEGLGVVDGDGVEVTNREARKRGGGGNLVLAVPRKEVAVVVDGHGAAAHVDAEFLPDEIGGVPIGEALLQEPVAHARLLLGGQAVHLGVAADSSAGLGGGNGAGIGGHGCGPFSAACGRMLTVVGAGAIWRIAENR